jgi:hypothetical protein
VLVLSETSHVSFICKIVIHLILNIFRNRMFRFYDSNNSSILFQEYKATGPQHVFTDAHPIHKHRHTGAIIHNNIYSHMYTYNMANTYTVRKHLSLLQIVVPEFQSISNLVICNCDVLQLPTQRKYENVIYM